MLLYERDDFANVCHCKWGILGTVSETFCSLTATASRDIHLTTTVAGGFLGPDHLLKRGVLDADMGVFF